MHDALRLTCREIGRLRFSIEIIGKNYKVSYLEISDGLRANCLTVYAYCVHSERNWTMPHLFNAHAGVKSWSFKLLMYLRVLTRTSIGLFNPIQF